MIWSKRNLREFSTKRCVKFLKGILGKASSALRFHLLFRLVSIFYAAWFFFFDFIFFFRKKTLSLLFFGITFSPPLSFAGTHDGVQSDRHHVYNKRDPKHNFPLGRFL